MEEQDVTRARMLGNLMQDARVHAGRPVEDCANVLGMEPHAYEAAEQGENVISLPALEVLAIYLGVPMAHFWGSQTLSDASLPNYDNLLELRHKIVGGLLRKARLAVDATIHEVAEAAGTTPERIEQYETGEVEVPFLQLETMADHLGVDMGYFLEDDRGPLGRHESQQRIEQRFHELPREIQEFVAQPSNITYLETAKRLSEMDVEKLRNIAAGILDITY